MGLGGGGGEGVWTEKKSRRIQHYSNSKLGVRVATCCWCWWYLQCKNNWWQHPSWWKTVSWAISSLETTFSKFPPTISRNLFKVREYTRVVNSGCWNVKQNKSYSWVLLAINRAQDTHGESLVNRSQPGSSVLQHFLRLLFVLMRWLKLVERFSLLFCLFIWTSSVNVWPNE